MPKIKILIVDDDAGIRFGIREFLDVQGYEVDEADSCQQARQQFVTGHPDIAVIDYKLPDGNALDLLPKLKGIDPNVPIVVLTGHATIDLAVRAIKEGADNFITKPVELPTLLVVLERLVEHRRNWQKQMAGESRLERSRVDPFMGISSAIVQLARDAERVVTSESPILIQGETGTGKGVLADWLHRTSRRSEEPFVDLNCAGLSREFLETELFGHEKGAFTGAIASKTGLLEVAHRGTIFLDEIGDMDPEIQPKLLKVLEEKNFRKLGSVRDRQVDVRLIAASHQDLAQSVQDGKFRMDLYYRLSTIPITVPALRDRIDDIPILARHLLGAMLPQLGRPEVVLTSDAERELVAYPWPGNIRELRNVLERAVLLTDGDLIEPDNLRFDLKSPVPAGNDDSHLTLREMEKQHILRVLKRESGRVAHAAKALGMPKSSLYQKIKKYDIDVSKV